MPLTMAEVGWTCMNLVEEDASGLYACVGWCAGVMSIAGVLVYVHRVCRSYYVRWGGGVVGSVHSVSLLGGFG